MVFVAGKTVWSMPEHFKVVCVPCKALYKCSALLFLHDMSPSQTANLYTVEKVIDGSRSDSEGMCTSHWCCADLHWLRSLECINFKLAVLVYRCLHGLTPWYFFDYIPHVADSNRRHLQSSSSSQLVIGHTRLSTVGGYA